MSAQLSLLDLLPAVKVRGIVNEADLIRALRGGTYTLSDMYRFAEEAGLADRPGGRKRIQDGKEQYRRRLRTALYRARSHGPAHTARMRALCPPKPAPGAPGPAR